MLKMDIEKSNDTITKINTLFLESQNIVIVSHINPDGDAIGSTIGLYNYLLSKDKNVTAIVPNEVPQYLKNISGVSEIHEYSKEFDVLDRVIEDATLIVCLDFNDITTRLGVMGEKLMTNVGAKKIIIDHHEGIDAEMFDVVISDVSAAATALLVANLLYALDGKEAINELSAEALYLGLMTDTGNFSYGNLSGDLFRTVAMLVDCGAKPVEINNKVLNVQTLTRTRLVGYCLYKKMKIVKHHRLAYITLTETELMNFNYRQGDTEGIVNMPLSIKGIELSAIFIENKECIKISLRSQGTTAVDVNRLARENFTGGGHKMAAGAKSFTTMDEAVSIFLKAVENIYK